MTLQQKRADLMNQRAMIDNEIKRLSEEMEASNAARLLPILQARRDRELAGITQAKQTGQSVVYKDDDGCEVECTPTGNIFYNAADWY